MSCPFCGIEVAWMHDLCRHVLAEHMDEKVAGQGLCFGPWWAPTRVRCWCGQDCVTVAAPEMSQSSWATHLQRVGGMAAHIGALALLPDTQHRPSGGQHG